MSVVSDPGNVAVTRIGVTFAAWVGLMLMVGATQSWDIVWLAAIVGLIAFPYLLGQRVDVPFQGDPTNLLVTFQPWRSVLFGRIAFGATVFGLLLSNILHFDGSSILVWGLVLCLVVRQQRKVAPSSQPMKRLVMRALGGELETPAPIVRTPEMDARDRFNSHVLHQAGLVWKSPSTGEMAVPAHGAVRFDRLGRPFFVAQMIEGRQTLDTWIKADTKIASAWNVLRVHVEPGLDMNTGEPIAGRVVVTAIVREFTRDNPVRWTTNVAQLNAGIDVVEHLRRLPMGEMAESSDPWYLSLVEANLVVGGIPGSGKSVFENGLIAHLAAHPHVEIGYIDRKRGVEAKPWKARLSAVAIEQEDSASLIKWMLADCEARYTRMEELGIKNAWTQGFLGEDEPVKVLVIDEASRLFKLSGGREARELVDQMTDDLASLVSIGRAAGFVVIVATQKPTAASLPTDIRDLASLQVAFRCTKVVAAMSILGDNFEPDDPIMSPTKITQAQRGQAITASETGELQRVQCALIDDATIKELSLAPWSGRQWPHQGQGAAPAVVAQSPTQSSPLPTVPLSKEPSVPTRRRGEALPWDKPEKTPSVDVEAAAEDVWADLLAETDSLPHPPLPKPRKSPRLAMFDEQPGSKKGTES